MKCVSCGKDVGAFLITDIGETCQDCASKHDALLSAARSLEITNGDVSRAFMHELHPTALRDMFAAFAMQRLMDRVDRYDCDHFLSRDDVASEAYEQADAMMEARKRK